MPSQQEKLDADPDMVMDLKLDDGSTGEEPVQKDVCVTREASRSYLQLRCPCHRRLVALV